MSSPHPVPTFPAHQEAGPPALNALIITAIHSYSPLCGSPSRLHPDFTEPSQWPRREGEGVGWGGGVGGGDWVGGHFGGEENRI